MNKILVFQTWGIGDMIMATLRIYENCSEKKCWRFYENRLG